VRMGPPNVLVPPKPRSSISTITTLGASLGALTSNRGGALALRASSSAEALYGVSARDKALVNR
jgi:hypothetical protein